MRVSYHQLTSPVIQVNGDDLYRAFPLDGPECRVTFNG